MQNLSAFWWKKTRNEKIQSLQQFVLFQTNAVTITGSPSHCGIVGLVKRIGGRNAATLSRRRGSTIRRRILWLFTILFAQRLYRFVIVKWVRSEVCLKPLSFLENVQRWEHFRPATFTFRVKGHNCLAVDLRPPKFHDTVVHLHYKINSMLETLQVATRGGGTEGAAWAYATHFFLGRPGLPLLHS